MFWDKDGDSDSWQRFKNASIIKMPVTNKERDEMLPKALGIVLILFVVFVVILGLIGIFTH